MTTIKEFTTEELERLSLCKSGDRIVIRNRLIEVYSTSTSNWGCTDCILHNQQCTLCENLFDRDSYCACDAMSNDKDYLIFR